MTADQQEKAIRLATIIIKQREIVVSGDEMGFMDFNTCMDEAERLAQEILDFPAPTKGPINITQISCDGSH